MVQPFVNEPLTDFSVPEQRAAFEQALAQVGAQLGRTYPLYIGGREVVTERHTASINPSQKDQVVGYVAKADQAVAEEAMQSALAAFETWKRKSFAERARYLLKAAAIMRRRKHELSAWMCYEAGKTWAEADADTAEAIDFLEFYAREAIRLGEVHPLVRIPGEDNEQHYIPLGVGIIIPPWNFPLAILTGMTSSAVVAGNTVLLKPATPTPVIAYKFLEVMRDAGIPAGVINFVPGSGAEIGDYLVDHPKTRFISFTGSKEVGIRIYERAAKVQPGQIWLKRVVAEMGGKDAIVVDREADLEEAARQIAASAFNFSGQKCSACSRAIIHQDVYDTVAERVVALAKSMRVGPATDGASQVGPVIDEAAYKKILEYIEVGKQEGKLLAGGGKEEGNGFFIQPTVFGDVDPRARIAQEEIFGPVVALIRAKDFEDAIRIANDTEFGLTGSVFSNNREHLEYARQEFHVGNLYFNRKCTGALVGVHPFGGFNMSGTDSKAGGRDYLLLFTQAKAVSEKL
ncbi:MAG: L-glutamate gamma-semialdehyde dehydrogenase [Alicyclobacillus macrosporangiidus]|uniref:L-glutamate gamma-semialdehyde dehydrogenase n=1 Tax=Alicyclobacillus macrosporangiidus TaxID=392015 RepID=UPI0026ECFE22|nr:L-glutamate gamma-semialdehyde dehydrogenase [Alicyclobacillus macrosporangiidus]MCL6597906.1 L-glutamate gamma-semialdehyde dehydrogenase [Alicyclobacillus macrosporangiidus]